MGGNVVMRVAKARAALHPAGQGAVGRSAGVVGCPPRLLQRVNLCDAQTGRKLLNVCWATGEQFANSEL